MESRIEARKAPNTLGYPPTESTGVCYLRLFADWTESASHLAVDDFERFRQELPKVTCVGPHYCNCRDGRSELFRIYSKELTKIWSEPFDFSFSVQ